MTHAADTPDSASIQAEVERLRSTSPDTKTLYREVAAALFFRFGVAPTANRLYQLVGKGSMATAASVLARFWQDLREHSRLRLEHPGVPEPLREVAGDLLGRLWTAAYDSAQLDLVQVREELQGEVEQARSEREEANQAATEANEKADQLTREVQVMRATLSEREALLSKREGEITQLQAEVAALQASVSERRAEVEAAKSAFASELEALRSAISLTEERARSSERRALAEIDAARRKADEAGKALAKHQKASTAVAARLEQSLTKRDAEVGNLQSRLARAEGAVAHASKQLKDEQAKFNRLLARVHPESRRAQSGGRAGTQAKKAAKSPKTASQRKSGTSEV